MPGFKTIAIIQKQFILFVHSNTSTATSVTLNITLPSSYPCENTIPQDGSLKLDNCL